MQTKITFCYSPPAVSDINKLESVQQRLLSFCHMTYDNHLKLLGLNSTKSIV